MRATGRRVCDVRRRGSVYLLVLGVSAIVLVIGMSALATVRVQNRGQTDQAHATQAQALADAGLQIALERLVADTNWRTTYTHDTWTAAEALADGSFTFKLIDQADTDLADDELDPFRILVRATRGAAVRLVGVEVEAVDPLGPELLTNGDLETGSTTPWVGSSGGSVSLIIDSTAPAEGSYALRVSSRSGRTLGPTQDLRDAVQTDATYRVQAWVKMKNSAESADVGLAFDTVLSLPDQRMVNAAVGTSWTLVAGDITADIANPSPSYLNFKIETATSAQEFWTDGASIREVLSGIPFRVVRGSYRRDLDQ